MFIRTHQYPHWFKGKTRVHFNSLTMRGYEKNEKCGYEQTETSILAFF